MLTKMVVKALWILYNENNKGLPLSRGGRPKSFKKNRLIPQLGGFLVLFSLFTIPAESSDI